MEVLVGYMVVFMVLGFVFAWWIDLTIFVFLRFFFTNSDS